MRLWHKDLIPYLPQKQLVAQWRELCCIAKNIADKGTPNHLLVNKVLDYGVQHFKQYSNIVLKEMNKRGYKISKQSYENFIENIYKAECENKFGIMFCNDLYEYWMDDRYLIQCYYNLQEKYDCSGLTDDEWNKIEEYVLVHLKYSKLLKLIKVSKVFENGKS